MCKLGSAAGTAIGGAGLAGTTATGAAILSGPVGWFVLGASATRWDCWRAVLHKPASLEDTGAQEEKRTLREVVSDDAVTGVDFEFDSQGNLAALRIRNVFQEVFKVTGVIFPDGSQALHAELDSQ